MVGAIGRFPMSPNGYSRPIDTSRTPSASPSASEIRKLTLVVAPDRTSVWGPLPTGPLGRSATAPGGAVGAPGPLAWLMRLCGPLTASGRGLRAVSTQATRCRGARGLAGRRRSDKRSGPGQRSAIESRTQAVARREEMRSLPPPRPCSEYSVWIRRHRRQWIWVARPFGNDAKNFQNFFRAKHLRIRIRNGW